MDDLDGLFEQLKDPDSKVRRNAAEKLGERRDASTIRALIEVLKYQNPLVREVAAMALGMIGDAEGVPALIEALVSGNMFVREKAAEALGKIGKPAVPALIRLLNDELERDRWHSAVVLGEIKDTRAVPALIEAAKGNDFEVKRAAVSALGKIRHCSAVPVLIDELSAEEDEMVMINASKALGRIADARAFPALLGVLYFDSGDVDRFVYRAIKKILKKCNSKDEIQLFEGELVEALSKLDKEYILRSQKQKTEFRIVHLRIKAISKKNELTKDKGILLDDKPKPPKKGRMYQQLRRATNG
jgi:HEAT repeat protein